MILGRCDDSLEIFNLQFSSTLSNSGEIRMIKATFLLDQFTDSMPSMRVVATTSQGKALKIRESRVMKWRAATSYRPSVTGDN